MKVESQFAQLIAPCTLEDFFQTYWEMQTLYLPRNNAAVYEDILTPEDIDRLLQNKALLADYNNFRLVDQGKLISLEAWCDRHPKSQQYFINNDKLYTLLHQGLTLTINSAHKKIPSLRQFCSGLESELKFKLRTNIYITPPHAQGLAPHYDEHDVLILQITGAKEWKLYPSTVELPSHLRDQQIGRHKLDAPDLMVMLQPGDLLYIPRGIVHQAASQETPSIHVSLGLYPTFTYELLEELVAIAQADPAFRKAIPHGFTSSEQQQTFYQQFQTLSQSLFSNINPAELVKRKYAAFQCDRKSEDQGRFQDLIHLPQLNPNSVVAHRPYILFTIDRSPTQIILNFYQKSLTFPIFLAPSLTDLLDHPCLAIRDIGGLINDAGRLALAKTLIQEGFLMIKEIHSTSSS
ncbi:cupin domain-containing protein [Acaryochloris sp. IP29b_bin.137]|uniref:cupin domain-containing protein n=1 Tax=Acaryochloris sp. IP29b_bin.137 TaxID=2969217 RepID=UPI00261F4D45|nr:cupin domain-containing protein [Acaryochloris sp. IP29b_bin.137]